jgi:hypothetical protein
MQALCSPRLKWRYPLFDHQCYLEEGEQDDVCSGKKGQVPRETPPAEPVICRPAAALGEIIRQRMTLTSTLSLIRLPDMKLFLSFFLQNVILIPLKSIHATQPKSTMSVFHRRL